MLQVLGCDKSMVDSKVIGMRKISMVDGNSNINKEPDSTCKHSSLWASLCAPLDIVPLLPCRCLTTDSLPRGYPGQYVRASAYAELDG